MHSSTYPAHLIAPLVLAAFLVSAVGCHSEGSCGNLFEILEECDKSFKQEESAFLGECKSRKSDNMYKAYIKCSAQDECVDYQSCVNEASQALQAAEKAARLKKGVSNLSAQIEKKAFREADSLCIKLNEEFPKHPGLTAICGNLSALAAGDLKTTLTQMRDSGKADQFFAKCYDYKYFARRLGHDAHTRAEILCNEVDVSRAVQKALAQARGKMAKKEAHLLFDCRFAYKSLKSLDSAWAKRTLKQIVDVCYVKLGRLILSSRVPAMKYACDLEVKKIYQVLRRREIDDEGLKQLLVTAKPLCSR